MNHGLALIVSFFFFFQTSFREPYTLRVFKVFTKTGGGPWLRGDCLGPAGIINCTPLSALSFWVSLFPGTRGYNTGTALSVKPVLSSTLPGPFWELLVLWHHQAQGRRHQKCGRAWRNSHQLAEWWGGVGGGSLSAKFFPAWAPPSSQPSSYLAPGCLQWGVAGTLHASRSQEREVGALFWSEPNQGRTVIEPGLSS